MEEEGKNYTCCLLVSEEEQAEDPEAYQCEECEYLEKHASLTQDDRVALELHGRLANRMVQDLGLVPVVFEGVGLQMSRRRIRETLDRLDVIHRYRCPLKPKDREPGDEEPGEDEETNTKPKYKRGGRREVGGG